MSCEHCKGHLPRLVTIDPLKDRLIDLQAKKLNHREATIEHMGRLIKLGRSGEALELAENHVNNQKFKG